MRCIDKSSIVVALALGGCAAAPEPDAARPAVALGTGAPERVSATAPARSAASWHDYRLRAARRIAGANPGATFQGELPVRLRSIPVLQVQLNRDGSVRQVVVLRTPKFSPETVKMAVAAVRRAEPFEPVGRLPQPWQFNETFLYNDDLKFQLRTLAAAP